MKILIVHNTYQQGGGEDVVAATEAALLAGRGHEVVWYRRHNNELRRHSRLHGVAAGLRTIWAADARRDLAAILQRERPDVAHFHNTFPLISPAAYYACANAGVPVVQTLHNYRLLCPGATLFRQGHVCEECVARAIPWRAVAHRCYRNSALATSAASAMLATHRALGSWRTKVDAYIAVSEFARQKFIQGGLPAQRIHVKPNFVHPDPGAKSTAGSYALFVGRLSEDKGVRVLLNAWRLLKVPIPLVIAGDGAMREEVAAASRDTHAGNIKLLGAVNRQRILELLHDARFLVFPGMLYEGAFPLAIIESFACGVPVIASRIGSVAEGIRDGENSLNFSPGDSDSLANLCEWAWTHPEEIQRLGHAARSDYEAKYTAETNYELLMNIYRAVQASTISLNARALVYGANSNDASRAGNV